MFLKQVFTVIDGSFFQLYVSIPSSHLDWLVFGKLSGLIGYLMLDPMMSVSYHQ